jgi:drug/metabolite transporter (DMT)-like permease
VEIRRKWPLLIPATFAVSWAAIIIKVCDAPATAIAFYRMLFAVALLFPFAITLYRKSFKEFTAKIFWATALAGFVLGWHLFFWIESLNHTSISSSVVIVTTQPIFVAILSGIFLKEKTGIKGITAIVMAIIGTILIAGFDFSLEKDYLWGDILAFLGALMAAGYLFTGRVVRARLNIFPYIFTVYSAAALTLGVILLLSGQLFSVYAPINYFYFFLLAAIPTLIGHSLYNYAIKHVKAFKVGLSIAGEPVLASIWAILIFAQYPSTGTILGGFLIIASLILVFTEKG